MKKLMHGGKRDGAGRKSARIDLGELEKLCALQCTDEDLAAFFGVTVRTIERRRQKRAFATVMERGRAKGRLSVRRLLFTQATNGNTAASIFLAKNLLGYRDVRSNQHSGPDGGPISIQNELDFARLSAEDLELLQTLREKAERREGENQ
ncbi:MAG: hypothetical protein ABSB35_37640 [Bryobacteraceae bacterium]|jgi:hypothetical protein